MAVLETIRNKFGILITVLIAIALLSFIIDPSSLSLFSNQDVAGNDIEVASVNGSKITYTDLKDKMDKYNISHNEALELVIMDKVYAANAKDAGFNVDDSELTNEETKKEDITYLLTNKYLYNLNKSQFTPSFLIEEDIKDANNLFNVEFVNIPFTTVPDPTVTVSQEEIEEYYNTNKEKFVSNETRDLNYVVVEFDLENEDEIYDEVENAFYGVKDLEAFQKAADDNGYFFDSVKYVGMTASTLGSISEVENVIKWAFKGENGEVSEIFPITNDDKNYLVIAAVADIHSDGYAPIELVASTIEEILRLEKMKDELFAEVTEKIEGLTDLKSIARALEASVSTSENLSFSLIELDQKFAGAVSVAETGVVSAPLKASNGIYVFKVTDRTVGGYYKEDSTNAEIAELNYIYSNMTLPWIMMTNDIKDYTYLYF